MLKPASKLNSTGIKATLMPMKFMAFLKIDIISCFLKVTSTKHLSIAVRLKFRLGATAEFNGKFHSTQRFSSKAV